MPQGRGALRKLHGILWFLISANSRCPQNEIIWGVDNLNNVLRASVSSGLKHTRSSYTIRKKNKKALHYKSWDPKELPSQCHDELFRRQKSHVFPSWCWARREIGSFSEGLNHKMARIHTRDWMTLSVWSTTLQEKNLKWSQAGYAPHQVLAETSALMEANRPDFQAVKMEEGLWLR